MTRFCPNFAGHLGHRWQAGSSLSAHAVGSPGRPAVAGMFAGLAYGRGWPSHKAEQASHRRAVLASNPGGLPLPRCRAQVFGVPNVSARFGTSPDPWNWGMVAAARLLPKSEQRWPALSRPRPVGGALCPAIRLPPFPPRPGRPGQAFVGARCTKPRLMLCSLP